jgi:hypothetical protein
MMMEDVIRKGRRGWHRWHGHHRVLFQNPPGPAYLVSRRDLDFKNGIHTTQADACVQIEATVPYATHTNIGDHFENGRLWTTIGMATF